MDLLGSNIKYLRKSKGLTQDEFAKSIGVTRAVVGSYEENRAIPKLNVLKDIAYFFNISIDNLVKLQLWKSPATINSEFITGSNIRVISTLVNNEDKELITTVPIQASAGYTNGYSDPTYIEKLPHFSLPLVELSKEKTYRVFQIKGDSMEPIKSGSYIICEYLINWNEIIDNKPYILISKDEGIVYKRLVNNLDTNNEFILKSDNPEYEPYTIKTEEVQEIWKALGFISFDLPEKDELSVNNLYKMVVDMKKDLEKLKK